MMAWLRFLSIIIWIIIFLYNKMKYSFATLCYVNSHYRYQRTSDVIPPDAPSQEVGHWSAIILHTARVFIALNPGVPLKITVPPITPKGRPAIIDEALRLTEPGQVIAR